LALEKPFFSILKNLPIGVVVRSLESLS